MFADRNSGSSNSRSKVVFPVYEKSFPRTYTDIPLSKTSIYTSTESLLKGSRVGLSHASESVGERGATTRDIWALLMLFFTSSSSFFTSARLASHTRHWEEGSDDEMCVFEIDTKRELTELGDGKVN